MNIADVFAAYGVKQNEQNKTAGVQTESVAEKSAASSVTEAILYTEDTQIQQKQTSELYSKSGMGQEETKQEVKEEGTEAEKNQERLHNVSDRMTEADMAKLQSEGFPVDEMTAEQLEAAMERIKLAKELEAGALEHQVEQIQSQREAVIAQAIKILAGNPHAEKIAEKLLKANLPVTQANLEKVAIAVEKATGGIKLSVAECEYMVRNKLAPTIENVAAAKTGAQSYQRKEHSLTSEAWAQLEPKVTHLLFQAGLRANNQMLEAAQTFVKKDIPLTVDNLKSYSLLAKINLSEDDVLQKAVDVLPGDTAEDLQLRIMQQAEWILLPKAVEMVSEKLAKEK